MKKINLPIWKNKTILEKILIIVCYILAISVFVLAVLDFFDVARLMFYYELLLGILLILEGFLYFKYEKKRSILLIVFGFILLICLGISLFF